MGRYSKALADKLSLCVTGMYPENDLKSMQVNGWVKELDGNIVESGVYEIEWKDYVPVFARRVVCDDFVRSGSSWIALRDGKYVVAFSFHQFLDCRVDVHRVRQMEILFEDDQCG